MSGGKQQIGSQAGPDGIRTVLVFACNLLGDAICRLPAIRAAKEAHPESHLIVVADPGCREVFEGQPFIDEVWILRRRGSPVSQAREWARLLVQARRAEPDMALDLYGSKRTALFSRLSGARHRLGLHDGGHSRHYTLRPTSASAEPAEGGHIIDRINRAVAPAGLAPPLGYCSLAVTEDERAQVSEVLRAAGRQPGRRLVVLNPGARVVAKQWPADRFGRLAKALSERGIQCVVITGPGQRALAEAVVEASGGAASGLPELGLNALAALMEEADLLVTGDTGVLHVGAATGVRSVVIAGPTSPSLFAGAGPKQAVLFHRGACEEWQEGDECPRANSCAERRCIDAVTVEEAAAAVEALLEEAEISPARRGESSEAAR